MPGGPGGDERVTLLTRAGCHLCDDARAAVGRVAAGLGLDWREVDVDSTPELADEYGDRVPVTLVDGREHGFWRVDEARLRRELTVGRWPWRGRPVRSRDAGPAASGRPPKGDSPYPRG